MELLSRAECCVKEYDFNLNHFYFCDFILYFLVIVSMEKGLSMEEMRADVFCSVYSRT